MVKVKNLENKELELPYEGNTYFFPAGKVVLIDENVCEYMKELWPLAFDYNAKEESKEPVPKVRTTKTLPMASKPSPISDMEATQMTGIQKGTFSAINQDTEGLYGPGLELDDLKE